MHTIATELGVGAEERIMRLTLGYRNACFDLGGDLKSILLVFLPNPNRLDG